MTISRIPGCGASAITVAAALGTAGAAWAQVAARAAGSPAATTISELTVTALKRQELLVNTPVAASTLKCSGSTLAVPSQSSSARIVLLSLP